MKTYAEINRKKKIASYIEGIISLIWLITMFVAPWLGLTFLPAMVFFWVVMWLVKKWIEE